MKNGKIIGLDGAPILKANAYEGAARTARTAGWSAPSYGPNRSLQNSIGLLRNRSRAGYRNSPLLRSGINKNTTNEVGKGLGLISTCLDDEFKLQANDLWKRVVNQLDPEEVNNFGSLVDIAVRARRTSGEVFIRLLRRRLSSGLEVPIQLELMEADLCPVSLNRKLKGNSQIIQGVEFKGKVRVAYWFYKNHPQDGVGIASLTDLERVPASSVIHHFRQMRPGQVRGEPDTVAVLLKDQTFHEYDDAELVRKKERSSFTGFLYRDDFDEDDFDFNPMTGQPLFEDADNPPSVNPVTRVEAGTMLRGAPGDKLELFDGDNTGSGYKDYIRWQALQEAAGMDIPYPLLTGDWSELNDRLVRAFLNEYRRGISFDQVNLSGFQIAFRVWRWVISEAVKIGRLHAPGFAQNPYRFWALDVRPDAFKWLHPEQDINSRQKAIANQLTNVESEAAEYGKDLEDNMRRNAKARKRWETICEEEGVSEPGELPGLFVPDDENGGSQ